MTQIKQTSWKIFMVLKNDITKREHSFFSLALAPNFFGGASDSFDSTEEISLPFNGKQQAGPTWFFYGKR